MKIIEINANYCVVISEVNEIAHRKAYANSKAGRAAFMAECAGAENYAEALAAWGDGPTVDDPEPISPEPTGPAGPTVEQRLDQLEADRDALTIAVLEGSTT